MTEGSRHEKAALTAVSYIIGFTAAFILFSNFTSDLFLPAATSTVSSAAVVTAVTEAPAVVESEPVVSNEPIVSYTDGRLEVTVGDAVSLLSFSPEESGIELDTEGLAQGFHIGDLKYSVDPKSEFVFFCERHDTDSETCSGYVYDINADRIYPVTKSGKAANISMRSADEAIFTAVGLKIGANYSANPKAPWVMISGEDALDLQ